MPLYDYLCRSCQCVTQEIHPMREIPRTAHCEKCGHTADKILSQLAAVTVHTDLLNDGKPQYVSQLATYQRKGKQDPRAYFTHKSQAQDAARRRSDSSDGYDLHLDS